MNNKWLHDLNKLGDYEKNAPEGLLNDIKAEMLRRGVAPAHVSGKKAVPSFMLWRRVAAVAIIAVALGAGVFWFTNRGGQGRSVSPVLTNNEQVAKASNGIAQSHTSKNVFAQEAYPENVNEEKTHFGRNEHRHPGTLTTENVATDGLIAELPQAQSAVLHEGAMPHDSTTTAPTFLATHTTRENEKTIQYDRHSEHVNYAHYSGYLSNVDNHKSSTVKLDAHFSGLMNEHITSRRGMMLASANPYGNYDADMAGSNSEGLRPTECQLHSKEHHDHPIRVGVSVRYHLNDKWSLQSGINYSFLSSDFTQENENSAIRTNQKLNYLGIPLSASYSIWRNKHVNFYITAGGQLEKLVSGKTKTKHIEAGKNLMTTNGDVKEREFVFSTNAAAGVEYSASRRISFYAEPGTVYYFKNGSDIRSIYTDKPLNFNLNIGLRINLNN